MIIDLHVHTVKGASDSSLIPSDAVAEAKRIGLDGICLTEHGGVWNKHELDEFAQQHDLLVLRGMELTTDLGHIVVFGLDGYVKGWHRADDLRRAVDEVGGFMIAVHPFRMNHMVNILREMFALPGHDSMLREPMVEKVLNRPLFKLVHEIEVLNGACSTEENMLTLEVARRLGMKGTGGSDAHSTHGLGCYTTIFENDIGNEQEFIRELKAGRFRPATGFREGSLAPV